MALEITLSNIIFTFAVAILANLATPWLRLVVSKFNENLAAKLKEQTERDQKIIRARAINSQDLIVDLLSKAIESIGWLLFILIGIITVLVGQSLGWIGQLVASLTSILCVIVGIYVVDSIRRELKKAYLVREFRRVNFNIQ